MAKHEQGYNSAPRKLTVAGYCLAAALGTAIGVSGNAIADSQNSKPISAGAPERNTPVTGTPSPTVTKSKMPAVRPSKSPSTTPQPTQTKRHDSNGMPHYASLKGVTWEPMKNIDNGAIVRKGTIVLDPSRSAKAFSVVDAKTKLKEIDKPVPLEQQETMSMALMLEKKLEKLGYNVVLTKSSVNDTLTSRERVNKALAAKADLAVGIYTAHDTDIDGQYVYVPQVGQKRGDVTYNNAPLACATQQTGIDLAYGMGKKLKESAVVTAERNYRSTTGAIGNISLRQLFASESLADPTHPIGLPGKQPNAQPAVSPIAKPTASATTKPTATPTIKSMPSIADITLPKVEGLEWVDVVAGAKFDNNENQMLPMESQQAWTDAAAEGIDEAMLALKARQNQCLPTQAR